MTMNLRNLRCFFLKDAAFQALPEYRAFLEYLLLEEDKHVTVNYLRKWIQQKQFPIDLNKIHDAMKKVEGYTDMKAWKQVLLSVSLKIKIK